MEKYYTCSICGKKCVGYGNNPQPIKDNYNERCCDECNNNYVIPARILVFKTGKSFKELIKEAN